MQARELLWAAETRFSENRDKKCHLHEKNKLSWRTPGIFLKPVINTFEAMKTNPGLGSNKKVMCCQYSRNEGEVKGHVLSAAEAVNSCTQPVFKAALLSLHNREVAGRDFIRLKAKTMSNSKPRLRRHKTTTLRSNSPNYTRNNQRALILAWKNITKVAASLFIPFETTAFNYSWSVQLSAHSIVMPRAKYWARVSTA